MKLKEIRKEKKYTQEQISKIIGVSRSFYGKIENEQTIITGDQIVKLCKFLNVSSDELLGLK